LAQGQEDCDKRNGVQACLGQTRIARFWKSLSGMPDNSKPFCARLSGVSDSSNPFCMRLSGMPDSFSVHQRLPFAPAKVVMSWCKAD